MIPASGQSSPIEDKLFPQKFTLQIQGRLLLLDKPKVMGIINLTPDSFYEGSRIDKSSSQLLFQTEKMLRDGADILDFGGYSTRPGAIEISIQEELDRVLPAIELIKNNFPEAILSVDTFRSKVADESIRMGAHMINDISAGTLDEEMLPLIGNLRVPYIAMHMKGNPQNMQNLTNYSDILVEILNYFAEKVELFKKFGIKDVIIDPGFGFAKSIEQNYFLLKHLSYFTSLGFPILAGLSRKSMIYKTLEISAKEALNGTTALNMFALSQGAKVLRVHDVKEANETVKLFEQLYP
jgi:dihydropteroate synthase